MITISYCFAPGKPFQPSSMFMGKAGCPLALPINIRLAWKDLPEANAIAYFEHP